MTINIYSVTAPAEDPNVLQSYKDFEEKGYQMVSDYEMNSKSYSSLKDIAIPYTMDYFQINLTKLMNDCGFDGMPYIAERSDECITFTDGVKKVIVGVRRVEQEYHMNRRGVFWVFKLDNVATWLGSQQFQSHIKDSFLKKGIFIFKKGYYKLDNSQIGMIDLFDNFTNCISNRREEFLVYNEE